MVRLQLPKNGVSHIFWEKKKRPLWPSFAPKDIKANIPIDFNWEKSNSKLNSIFLMYF